MDNRKVKLTKAAFANAKPAEREYMLWDSRIAGFGLRVRPSGSKSFVFVYRSAGGRAGKVQRVTIKADHPDVAYERAKQLAGQHHGGRDPVAEKQKADAAVDRARRTLTVGAVLDRFIAEHAKPNLKAKTWREYERLVEKALKPAIGNLKIDALGPVDVRALYDGMRATPTQATLTVRILSSAMSWAEEAGLRPPGSNPAKIRLKGTRRRERLFSDAEVARLQSAISALEAEGKIRPPVALGLRLLFETGCRASEVGELRWSNVDLEVGVLRWPDSKTGFLSKPITPAARALLKKADRIVGIDWVCPSTSPKKHLRVETLEGGFERAMKRAKVVANENATLHLVRHWFASKIYTDKTIPLPVQMAIVGHKSVSTAMRYAHVRPDEVAKAAREAATRRTRAIREAGKSERGKIVPIGQVK